MNKLRVVFLGQNSDVTLVPLRAVAERHGLVAIVEAATREFAGDPADSPELRRMVHRSRLSKAARRYGVPHFFFRTRAQDELAEFLRSIRADLVCVSSSPFLKSFVLTAPTLGFINFHPSMLPFYRGPNPWFWQYYFVERQGGVTINFLDDAEDTGDIIYQDTYPIDLGMPLDEVQALALAIGERLMARAVQDLDAGNCPRKPQRHLPCPFRAHHIARDEPLVEWDAWPIERVWHVLRGTSKWLDPIARHPDADGPWLVGPMARSAPTGPAGTVDRDDRGYHVNHREGIIRLSLPRPLSRPDPLPGVPGTL